MFRKFWHKSVLVVFIAVSVLCLTLTDTPVQQEEAEASMRHKCNCRTVEVEVYDGPRGRTTWGAIKQSGTRIITREECDIKWHFNPFFHHGACD